MSPIAVLFLAAASVVALRVDAAPAPAVPPGALEITGFVRGTDGPVPDARAALLPLPSNHDWHRGLLAGAGAPDAVAAVVAGPDGRFAVAAPAPGMWSLAVSAPGRVPMRYVPLAVTAPRELPPLALLADTGIEVAVRWRDGAPAAAAWVLLTTGSPELWRPLQADGWSVAPRLARTDAAGRLTLPRSAGEAVEVTAFAHGARATTAVAGGTARATVVLAPPGSRSAPGSTSGAPPAPPIELRHPGGSPVAGAVVIAGSPAWPLGTTDGEGRLVLPPDAAGPLEVLLADGRRFEIAALPAAPADNPREPRRIDLPPLPRLEGKVVDAATRRPLAGALVWPGDDPGGATFTDERGTYTVAARQAGRAWVQAEARGFLPRAVRLPRPGDPPAVLAVALEPAGSLAGRTVDAAGKPVPGVVVTAALDAPPRHEVFRRDRAAGRAVSDGEGRFLLHGLPAAPAYEVAAIHPGYRAARQRVPARRLARLVLTPARAGFGLATDAAESPLAGVEVTVRAAAAGATPAAGAETVTVTSDERGRFEIPALPAERVDLEARRAGFAPLIVPGLAVPPGPGAADLGMLTLVAGAAVDGRVVDEAGRSLDGVRVWWTEADRRPGPALAESLRRREAAAVSGADGGFTIPDLARGRRMSLLFAREGSLPAWVSGVQAPTESPLVVVLERATSLRGGVETASGEPVPGASVHLRPAPPPPGTVGVEARRPVNTADARTGADGTFAFTEVAAGSVLLEAQAPGFLPLEPVAVEVPAEGEVSNVRLVLDPGAEVRGRVSTRGGEPVADASIRIGPAGAATDAEGRYRMAGVPLGVKALVLTHPAYRREVRELEVLPGINEVDLTAEEGLAVSGRVLDEAGAPQPGAVVTLRNRGERGPRALAATADGEGRFRVLAVVDGQYGLEAEAPGFAPAVHPRVVAVSGQDVGGLEVVLRRGATLTGKIRGVDLEHLAAVEVTAERAGRAPRPGAVDYRGQYRILHLEPGDWHLRARLDGGRREAGAWVAIAPADREVERDLELAAGLVLDGQVVLEGRALPGAQVSLRGLDVVADRNVATDHQGAFRLENLEPGRYRLEVVHGERMLSQSQDVELGADRTMLIEVTTAALTGRVVAAGTGEGVADALVSLQRLLAGNEPGPLTTVGTDAAGAFVTATLAPGRYVVTARADRFAPEQRLVEMAPGPAPEPLTIELRATEGLSLTILRTAGHPPSRATVLVLGGDGRPVHAEDLSLSDYGHGSLRQAPPGTWTLLVAAPGSAAVLARATVPGDRLEVTLPPAAPLTVRVPALLDSPVAASVAVVAADGTPFLGVVPGGTLQQSWPLAGGLATVPDLPAGTWRLHVTAADGRAWDGALATTGESAATAVLE